MVATAASRQLLRLGLAWQGPGGFSSAVLPLSVALPLKKKGTEKETEARSWWVTSPHLVWIEIRVEGTR